MTSSSASYSMATGSFTTTLVQRRPSTDLTVNSTEDLAYCSLPSKVTLIFSVLPSEASNLWPTMPSGSW